MESRKLEILIAGAIIVIITILAVMRIDNDIDNENASIERQNRHISKQIEYIYIDEIDKITKPLISRGQYLSGLPHVITAFKEQNKEELMRYSQEGFDRISSVVPTLTHMHWILPDMHSLLEVEKSQTHKTDISKTHHGARSVLKQQRVVEGFIKEVEGPQSKLLYKVIIPVFEKDRFLGMLEFGADFSFFPQKIDKLFRENFHFETKSTFILTNGKDKNANFVANEEFFSQLHQQENLLNVVRNDESALSVKFQEHYYHIERENIVLHDENGNKIGNFLSVCDITDHIMIKHATIKNGIIKPLLAMILILTVIHFIFKYFLQKITLSEERIKTILDVQSNITALTDGVHIKIANKMFYKFFGFGSLEAFKKEHACICEYFEGDPAIYLQQYNDGILWTDYMMQNRNTLHKVKMKSTKGEWHIFLVALEEFRFDMEQKEHVMTFTDISELEDLQEELKRAKDVEVEANRAKSLFLANMSHEIRTPLNAILGFVDILIDKEDDTTKLQYLQTIHNSSHLLLGIIGDILDFNKIESGQIAIDKVDFDPQKTFRTTAQLFEAKAQEKGIHFDVTLTGSLPDVLYSDPLRLNQVISNLLSNALKFTDKNGTVTLVIDYDQSDQALKAEVSDTGIGIAQDKIDKVFQAFVQAETSTTRKYGGTGLGLNISYRLIELLDGKLVCSSKLGEGSTFYFSIPCHMGRSKNHEPTKVDNDRRVLSGKILLVEDNKTNQLLMSVLLKKMGFTYEIANDGVEAIEMFQKNHFDIILMDENMPNMNGTEATKRIIEIEQKNALEHTPIIALTANALSGDRERFLDAGMDEYLTKPLNKEKLSEVLHRVGK